MLDESLRLISASLDDSAKVLDVGGWARPFTRADWVLDLMPHETRGMLGHDGEGDERFSAETWVARDICDREPWPFEDGSFDFVVCSHTLEDLRDPVWVCGELQRVARAGYVEVPSRLEEQSWNVQGPWVGWGHHHWLIDVGEQDISCVFKPHILGGLPGSAFPAGFAGALSDADRVQTLWWEGAFEYRERLFYEPEELNAYLADFVARNLGRAPAPGLVSRLRAAARARSG
jgi:hypothetical protein